MTTLIGLSQIVDPDADMMSGGFLWFYEFDEWLMNFVLRDAEEPSGVTATHLPHIECCGVSPAYSGSGELICYVDLCEDSNRAADAPCGIVRALRGPSAFASLDPPARHARCVCRRFSWR